MHDAVFRERRRMRPIEWRVGYLKGYRLRFNLDGVPRGRSAPANIAADPGAEVWGVLYQIKRRDMLRLNRTEGVPGGAYRPIWLDVNGTDGRIAKAMTYIASGNPKDGRPSLRYIKLLRDGARAHGLPLNWLEILENIAHAE